MSRCHLSLLYPSQWALLSGGVGSVYPPLTYVLLSMQESLQKIHSCGPLCRGAEQDNGSHVDVSWFYLQTSVYTKPVYTCSRQVHKCKLHARILKIGYPSWIHEVSSSVHLFRTGSNSLNYIGKTKTLLHEIVFPNNFFLLLKQFCLCLQARAYLEARVLLVSVLHLY